MCGIAGVVKCGGANVVDSGDLRRMCAAMGHRGPDDEGFYLKGQAGLGMRRLSIIDLATGHQPICNEDGTLWIVLNGEIYNHATLRRQLEARGHRYKTQSDTETVIHAYEEYGRDCVKHFKGMFAFAIWDEKARRLFIARDRFGIKPLYYSATSKSFIFASEIKSVLAQKDLRAELNRACLPEFLAFGYVSGEETFYKGIHTLMPGHLLELDEHGDLLIEQYWDLKSHDENINHNSTYYVEQYRDLLEKAVSSHLTSDVPVGVLLSGGLDSSAIAALMTKERDAALQTFSVGYSEQPYSELPYARVVAKHLNSAHHEVLITSDQFFNALPKLIRQQDEPIAWPSSVALYFVARLAAAHVKVVLTGEGSDETLAGYTRYAFTLKNAAYNHVYKAVVPGAVRSLVRERIGNSSWLSAPMRRKLSHTFLARYGETWNSLYFDNFFSAFGFQDQKKLLMPDFAQELKEGAVYGNVLKYWKHSQGEMLHRLLYTDIKTYLVALLMKQDKMSMAASIESRVPFLDHELVEFATSIPASVQLRGISGKQVLKKAMAELLPDSIVNRPKLGFPTPWQSWLSGKRLNSIEEMLLERRSIERGFFRPSVIRKLFTEHRGNHWDHSDRIWRLLNFELWQRVCLEGSSNERLNVADEESSLVQH